MPPTQRFSQALALVAGMAQALHVVIVIGATLCQGFDVVALRGQRDAAQALTLHAQRVALEQAITHRL